MRIKVDKIVPTPSGLRLGCVAYYSDDGPVRFVDAEVDYDLFTADVVFAIGKALDRALDREPAEDPLF
jgi:hypothetical protein